MSEEDNYDPFGKDVTQALLITNMKIYDVLMALLGETNPSVADKLDELHTGGRIMGLSPMFREFLDHDLEKLPDD
jgi:hypothetical protein